MKTIHQTCHFQLINCSTSYISFVLNLKIFKNDSKNIRLIILRLHRNIEYLIFFLIKKVKVNKIGWEDFTWKYLIQFIKMVVIKTECMISSKMILIGKRWTFQYRSIDEYKHTKHFGLKSMNKKRMLFFFSTYIQNKLKMLSLHWTKTKSPSHSIFINYNLNWFVYWLVLQGLLWLYSS